MTYSQTVLYYYYCFYFATLSSSYILKKKNILYFKIIWFNLFKICCKKKNFALVTWRTNQSIGIGITNVRSLALSLFNVIPNLNGLWIFLFVFLINYLSSIRTLNTTELSFSKNEILVIESYRHLLDSTQIEVPSGYIDECESPEEAVIWEVKEETCYAAKDVISIGHYTLNYSMFEQCA